jgi:hypothetical protein
MEDELTVVAGRKEVLTEPRHKEKYRDAGQKKGGDEEDATVDKSGESGVIGLPNAFESALERALEPHQWIP